MIRELILKNRSYRRYFGDEKITKDELKAFVELARISPSAANRQPLKYFLSDAEPLNSSIFQCLAWAGYLKDWKGPEKDERPTAYIVILGDTEISKSFFETDYGIAAQSMLLGAVEKGYGGCILAAVDRNKLREVLSLSEQYTILAVIALGRPKEEVVIETLQPEGDIKYWRDEQQVHHVPKRSLDELIIN